MLRQEGAVNTSSHVWKRVKFNKGRVDSPFADNLLLGTSFLHEYSLWCIVVDRRMYTCQVASIRAI
jgi:hypothetical protein